jgi:hypothetical protein
MGADGSVDTPPNMLPRNEPSSVRDSMNFAMKKMTKQRKMMNPNALQEAQHAAGGAIGGAGAAGLGALRRAAGAAVTQQERSAWEASQRAKFEAGQRRNTEFDQAMQSPALKNLGL